MVLHAPFGKPDSRAESPTCCGGKKLNIMYARWLTLQSLTVGNLFRFMQRAPPAWRKVSGDQMHIQKAARVRGATASALLEPRTGPHHPVWASQDALTWPGLAWPVGDPHPETRRTRRGVIPADLQRLCAELHAGLVIGPHTSTAQMGLQRGPRAPWKWPWGPLTPEASSVVGQSIGHSLPAKHNMKSRESTWASCSGSLRGAAE